MKHESRNLTYRVPLSGGQSRLREMILYIAEKYSDAPFWGKTKLNKILWRADFTSFYERSVPVTGRAYQRLKYGPAPVEMAPILGEMQNSGLIEIDYVEAGGGFSEERIIPKTPPSLVHFSPDDLRFIDDAISYYWDYTAAAVSEDSHGVAWKTRMDGDAMPYESAYLSERTLPLHIQQKIVEIGTERAWKSE